MKGPLISVVTPCWNSARFIEACIKSSAAQTYPHVDHIVQDGASADGTVEILREHGAHVDWVSEPDKGQADLAAQALRLRKY